MLRIKNEIEFFSNWLVCLEQAAWPALGSQIGRFTQRNNILGTISLSFSYISLLSLSFWLTLFLKYLSISLFVYSLSLSLSHTHTHTHTHTHIILPFQVSFIGILFLFNLFVFSWICFQVCCECLNLFSRSFYKFLFLCLSVCVFLIEYYLPTVTFHFLIRLMRTITTYFCHPWTISLYLYFFFLPFYLLLFFLRLYYNLLLSPMNDLLISLLLLYTFLSTSVLS